MFRLLPAFLLVVLATIFAFNFQTIRREVSYKFGISGDPTQSCCKVADILKSDGSFDENASTAVFNNQVIDYPKTSLAYAAKAQVNQDANTQVLGTTSADGTEKWIEISLSKQLLTAWEGDQKVMEFPISSGKWGLTPAGTFNIWSKTRSQSMIGGSKELGTYYNLPNVPNNMFFYQGYALHGAYWHNNFGNPMSHGCVNEPLANAAQIFEWAGPNLPAGENAVRATADNPGTRVVVHE